MGSSGGSSEHILRQFSTSDGGHQLGEEWAECGGAGSRRGSMRWSKKKRGHRRGGGGGGGQGYCGRSREEAPAGRKRVMVVVDQSSGAKHAMMWALTHVASKGDFVTLLHVLPRGGGRAGDDASALANSLGSHCKACKPEKLDASVLVLSQCKPSPFCCFMRSSGEEFVEECINRADCLTLAVRRQSKGVGGYLISTRWQKNFWLLA
ncbi:hypothetical protein ABZP36_028516 [Zizania latifolia]